MVPTKYWNTVAPGYTLNSSIQYDQQAQLLIQIQDKLFHIRLYGYPSLDPDLLLGKNFLLQFHSVMQTKQSLTFVTPCLHSVRCARLLTAYAHHDVRFQAKRGSLVYYSHATENDTSQYQALFEQAKRTFTEDPLAFWERDKAFAKLNPIDPTKIIRVRPMRYTAEDREEFAKQISDLLKQRLIRPSISPHSSPAFLVRNHAEQKRGKARMVINYKALNDNTKFDGYYLPHKDELIKFKNI